MTGTDPFNTSVFATRPGINAPAGKAGLVTTPYGLLDPNPVPGETMIARNSGKGPMQAQVNLRVAKIWKIRKYTVNIGVSARNMVNHTNAGPIIGNINSPRFGLANRIAGGPNGEGFSENANNRRLEMQARFTY